MVRGTLNALYRVSRSVLGPVGCSVQCAVFNVKCAACSVQCAVCSVQCAVFNVKNAVYSVHQTKSDGWDSGSPLPPGQLAVGSSDG